jgi:hypothetical protein
MTGLLPCYCSKATAALLDTATLLLLDTCQGSSCYYCSCLSRSTPFCCYCSNVAALLLMSLLLLLDTCMRSGSCFCDVLLFLPLTPACYSCCCDSCWQSSTSTTASADAALLLFLLLLFITPVATPRNVLGYSKNVDRVDPHPSTTVVRYATTRILLQALDES